MPGVWAGVRRIANPPKTHHDCRRDPITRRGRLPYMLGGKTALRPEK